MTQLGENKIFHSMYATRGEFSRHMPPETHTTIVICSSRIEMASEVNKIIDAVAPATARNDTRNDLKIRAAVGLAASISIVLCSCSSEFTLVATVHPSLLLRRGVRSAKDAAPALSAATRLPKELAIAQHYHFSIVRRLILPVTMFAIPLFHWRPMFDIVSTIILSHPNEEKL